MLNRRQIGSPPPGQRWVHDNQIMTPVVAPSMGWLAQGQWEEPPFTGGARVDRIQWRKVWIRRPTVKGGLEVVPAMGSPDPTQPATGGSDLEPCATMNRSLQHEAGTDGGEGRQGRRLKAHEDSDLKLLARRQQ
jgi:hypothetical protein